MATRPRPSSLFSLRRMEAAPPTGTVKHKENHLRPPLTSYACSNADVFMRLSQAYIQFPFDKMSPEDQRDWDDIYTLTHIYGPTLVRRAIFLSAADSWDYGFTVADVLVICRANGVPEEDPATIALELRQREVQWHEHREDELERRHQERRHQ